uniref:Uncharacterized protein n=1 Tax=Salix viminalis TaxID=40686 RepID=A0A6N2LDA6_SALVM
MIIRDVGIGLGLVLARAKPDESSSPLSSFCLNHSQNPNQFTPLIPWLRGSHSPRHIYYFSLAGKRNG